MAEDLAAQVSGVGALADPVRRGLYQFVVDRGGPVSRDEAAAGVDVPRHTAKFHLDRLVDEGLLDVEFRRLSGRRGPGAGRPSKLYRRSDRQFAVTLPERHYALAGDVLAAAVDRAMQTGVPVATAVRQAAAEAGRGLVAERTAAAEGDVLDGIAGLLREQGYEPRRDDDGLVLGNCPFHALARDHTALVCGMNRDLLSAELECLGCDQVTAELDPGEGRCCVRLVRGGGDVPGGSS
jgi:predicted ArsR family transcriptional regulator